MKKRIMVYILTKEGRAYNAKGIQLVVDEMKNEYGIDKEDLNITEGAVYNDTKILGEQLLENDESYIFVSRVEGVSSLGSEWTKGFGEKLLDSNGLTSWEIANNDSMEATKLRFKS